MEVLDAKAAAVAGTVEQGVASNARKEAAKPVENANPNQKSGTSNTNSNDNANSSNNEKKKKGKKKKKSKKDVPPYKTFDVVEDMQDKQNKDKTAEINEEDGIAEAERYKFIRKVCQFDVLCDREEETNGNNATVDNKSASVAMPYKYNKHPGNVKYQVLVELSQNNFEKMIHQNDDNTSRGANNNNNGNDSEAEEQDNDSKLLLARSIVETIQDEWHGLFLRKVKPDDPSDLRWVPIDSFESVEEVLKLFKANDDAKKKRQEQEQLRQQALKVIEERREAEIQANMSLAAVAASTTTTGTITAAASADANNSTPWKGASMNDDTTNGNTFIMPATPMTAHLAPPPLGAPDTVQGRASLASPGMDFINEYKLAGTPAMPPLGGAGGPAPAFTQQSPGQQIMSPGLPALPPMPKLEAPTMDPATGMATDTNDVTMNAADTAARQHPPLKKFKRGRPKKGEVRPPKPPKPMGKRRRGRPRRGESERSALALANANNNNHNPGKQGRRRMISLPDPRMANSLQPLPATPAGLFPSASSKGAVTGGGTFMLSPTKGGRTFAFRLDGNNDGLAQELKEANRQNKNHSTSNSNVNFIQPPPHEFNHFLPQPLPPERHEAGAKLVQARSFLKSKDPEWIVFYDQLAASRVSLYINAQPFRWTSGILRHFVKKNSKHEKRAREMAEMTTLNCWISEQQDMFREYCKWETQKYRLQQEQAAESSFAIEEWEPTTPNNRAEQLKQREELLKERHQFQRKLHSALEERQKMLVQNQQRQQQQFLYLQQLQQSLQYHYLVVQQQQSHQQTQDQNQGNNQNSQHGNNLNVQPVPPIPGLNPMPLPQGVGPTAAQAALAQASMIAPGVPAAAGIATTGVSAAGVPAVNPAMLVAARNSVQGNQQKSPPKTRKATPRQSSPKAIANQSSPKAKDTRESSSQAINATSPKTSPVAKESSSSSSKKSDAVDKPSESAVVAMEVGEGSSKPATDQGQQVVVVMDCDGGSSKSATEGSVGSVNDTKASEVGTKKLGNENHTNEDTSKSGKDAGTNNANPENKSVNPGGADTAKGGSIDAGADTEEKSKTGANDGSTHSTVTVGVKASGSTANETAAEDSTQGALDPVAGHVSAASLPQKAASPAQTTMLAADGSGTGPASVVPVCASLAESTNTTDSLNAKAAAGPVTPAKDDTQNQTSDSINGTENNESPAAKPLDETDEMIEVMRAKILLLDDVHFVWQPDQEPPADAPEDWKSFFYDLREFVRSRGDTAVPDTVELGGWCQLQRMLFQRSLAILAKKSGVTALGSDGSPAKNEVEEPPLSRGQMAALRGLGFDWEDLESSQFNTMFMKLLEFRTRVGDCLVPPPDVEFHDESDDEDGKDDENDCMVETKADPNLFFWVSRQRIEYMRFQNAKELESKAKRLEAAGVDEDGDELVQALLREEKKKAGAEIDDLEKNKTPDGKEATAKRKRRNQMKVKAETKACEDIKSSEQICILTQKQVDMLNNINFIWSPDITAKWILQYRRLQAFYIKNGHSKVTRTTNEAKTKLNRWCTQMRQLHQKKTKGPDEGLIPEKIMLLKNLDFHFEFADMPERFSFYERFEWLKQFKEENGHCDVPQKHETLGHFVKRLRKEYELHKRGERKMKPEKIEMLNKIGFTWRVRVVRGSRRRTKSLQCGYDDDDEEDDDEDDDDDDEEEDEDDEEADDEDDDDDEESDEESPRKRRRQSTGDTPAHADTYRGSFSLRDQYYGAGFSPQNSIGKSPKPKSSPGSFDCFMCRGAIIFAAGQCTACQGNYCPDCYEKIKSNNAQKCTHCQGPVLSTGTAWGI